MQETDAVAGLELAAENTNHQVVELATAARGKFLEEHSAVMRPTDAADLRWYCRSGGFGVFTPSPTATLMATLEMYGQIAEPCERCGGDREKWTPGWGFVATKHGRKPAGYEAAYALLVGLDVDGRLPPEPDALCPSCQGRGWSKPRRQSSARAAITARPSGKRQSDDGVSIADANIARLGLVSRRLSAVAAVAQVARAALESYYAPDGGDAGSLWHLVPAGKTMMRDNPQKLPPAALFSNIRAAQAEKPSPKRKAQIEAAEEQGQELYVLSCRVWNSVVRPDERKLNYSEDAK